MAARNQQLADTFRVLPTFLTESRKTLVRLTAFTDNANPLVTQLRPAARQLSPTLIELEQLAPDLLGLFRSIDPLVKVSKTGLPATSDFLDQLRPLLDQTDPFLVQLNPILDWVGLYKHELTQFFGNDVGSTQATGLSADGKTQLHYLRTTNPFNPENLALYPHRLATNRSNPYLDPMGYMKLATQGHLDVFGSYLCTTNPVAPISPTAGDLIPQSLLDNIQKYAFNGGNVPAPPCTAQQPVGNVIGQPGLYPHVEAAP